MPRQLRRCVFCVTVVFAVVGCSGLRQIEWTEDVQITGGGLGLVHRVQVYRSVMDMGAGFERGWNFEYEQLSATRMPYARGEVNWKGTTHLIPLVLDVIEGRMYLVTLAGPAAQDQYRLPRTERYVVFRWVDDNWLRIPFDDLPLSAKPNLFVSQYKYFLQSRAPAGNHINLELKKKWDSNPLISEGYRSIVRFPKSEPKR
jgi:hypothetical protein